MKYFLRVKARPNLSCTVEEKHASVVRLFSGLPVPWGWSSDPPVLSKPGAFSHFVRLSRHLHKGITGDVQYLIRMEKPDSPAWNDQIDLKFDPAKMPLADLCRNVIPRMIAAFHPYHVEMYNDDDHFLDKRFDFVRSSPTFPGKVMDSRGWIFRVTPIAFYDERLCREAFRLSPQEVHDRLLTTAEEVHLLEGGVYIIGSTKPLDVAATDDLMERMTRILKPLGEFFPDQLLSPPGSPQTPRPVAAPPPPPAEPAPEAVGVPADQGQKLPSEEPARKVSRKKRQ